MRLALAHLVFLQQIFSAMRYLSLFMICAVIAFTSCSNEAENKQHTDTQESPEPQGPPQSRLDDANTQRLMNVVGRYYTLKDALVASEAGDANVAAIELNNSIKDFQQYLLTDSANTPVLQPYIDTIILNADSLIRINDKTTEGKRVYFEKVSDGMYGLLRAANLKNVKVYRQYCPMAFNDKGAYWLSNETEIKNPYFGKKMLECGEVTDTLK